MASYKAPDFNERTALAKQAKLQALAKLKTPPPADAAKIAAEQAAQRTREEASAAKRQARRELDEQKKQAKLAPPPPPEPVNAPKVRTEAELKAARDARYAARTKRRK